MVLKYKGKRCSIGRRGGVYLHTKKGKKYLKKSQKQDVTGGNIHIEWKKKIPTKLKIKIPRRNKKRKTGKGLLRPWGSPPGFSP